MSTKYNIILSDPPWSYRDKAGARGADKKYEVLTTQALCDTPVQNLAAENCAYFMWTTGPMMPDALKIMQAHGFRYINVVFTWIKQNKKSKTLFTGMGHYTRSNPEFVILGMKGKLERCSKSVHSVIISPRGEHSAKPPEIRDRIVQLFGDISRVELFARDRCGGWTQTGSEMDGLSLRRFILMQEY